MSIKSLLWIEEEITDRLAERHMYLESTYEFLITTTGNATDAMRLLESSDFDSILLDIRIPQGDGFHLAKGHPHFNRIGLEVICRIHSARPAIMSKIKVYTNERWTDICEFVLPCGIRETQFKQKSHARTFLEFYEFVANLRP